jgi:hypothetical protein
MHTYRSVTTQSSDRDVRWADNQQYRDEIAESEFPISDTESELEAQPPIPASKADILCDLIDHTPCIHIVDGLMLPEITPRLRSLCTGRRNVVATSEPGSPQFVEFARDTITRYATGDTFPLSDGGNHRAMMFVVWTKHVNTLRTAVRQWSTRRIHIMVQSPQMFMVEPDPAMVFQWTNELQSFVDFHEIDRDAFTEDVYQRVYCDQVRHATGLHPGFDTCMPSIAFRSGEGYPL